MNRRNLIVVVMMLVAVSFGQGQWKSASALTPPAQVLSGSLTFDLLGAASRDSISGPGPGDVMELRSPLRAALYSGVIPGAGQYYNESYWKAGVFLALEAAAWIVYFSYDKKGNDQTDVFQSFADKHWSVVEYTKWIGREFSDADISGIIAPSVDAAHPWDYVDWSKLNQVEEFIAQKATSGVVTGFTHRLPHRPEQQYFELIGKYPQFLGGWDDAGLRGKADILSSNVSPNFGDYSLMRGRANDYYTVAQGVSIGILANHLASALEAAWEAARINHRIRLRSDVLLQSTSQGRVAAVPRMIVEYQF